MKCCERSYAGSQRPCPRCANWICHRCGVISAGALVCSDCSLKPPPATAGGEGDLSFLRIPEFRYVPAAFVIGLLGSILGAFAWVGLAAATGFLIGAFGVLTGLGARLGVAAAVRSREGCVWPVVSALCTIPGFFTGVWLVSWIAARAAAPGTDFFTRPVFEALKAGLGFGTLLWLAAAILAAVLPLGRR